jgi:hypothetical protein
LIRVSEASFRTGTAEADLEIEKSKPENLEATTAPENCVAALRILNYAFEADKTRQSGVHSEAGSTDEWPGKE